MNSEFEEVFKERYPNIQVVYDYFHIVKYLNEKIIAIIRIDEQQSLMDEGNYEAAKSLNKTRYILTSNKSTLEKKDEEVKKNKVIIKGSKLFNNQEITRKGNYIEYYENLINENEMVKHTNEIMGICE